MCSTVPLSVRVNHRTGWCTKEVANVNCVKYTDCEMNENREILLLYVYLRFKQKCERHKEYKISHIQHV